ncbi:MAG TPA: RDD family protein [Asanoa sp.]
MTSVAPGWYQDPADPTTQRYWDGEGWVGAPLPADATPPEGPPPEPSSGATASAPALKPDTPAPVGVGGAAASPAPPTAPPAPVYPGAPYPGSQHPGGRYPGPSAGGPGAGSGRPAPAAAPAGYVLAPPGLRLAARLIDIAIVLALNVVANGYLFYLLMREVLPVSQEMSRRIASGESMTSVIAGAQTSGRATLLQWAILVVAALVWLAYEVPAVARSGQTFGKRAVGIRIVRLDGQTPVGPGRSLRRWNILGVPLLFPFCCIGPVIQVVDCAWLLFDRPLRQALHDKAAQTVVVLAPRGQPQNLPTRPGGPS